MKSIAELDALKEESCPHFDAYDFLLALLQDYYYAKFNGIERIKHELANWDEEARAHIISVLGDKVDFDPDNLKSPLICGSCDY